MHPLPEIFLEVFNQSKNAMTITNPNENDNPIIFANKAFCDIFGYSIDEIINKNCRFLHKNDRDQKEILEIKKAILNQESITTTLRNYKKDGTQIFVELSIS